MTPQSAPSSPTPQDILVLGLGNPLMGDDGAGLRAVELLAEKDLPPHVHLQPAGLPGWGLPNWLEGWTNVILVDAVQMGQPPGTWRKFQLEEVQVLLQDGRLSLHQPGLAAGLALAQALDMLPPNLLVFGIEPAQTAPGSPLSPEVQAGFPDFIEGILQELADFEPNISKEN